MMTHRSLSALFSLLLLASLCAACGKKDVTPDPEPVETRSVPIDEEDDGDDDEGDDEMEPEPGAIPAPDDVAGVPPNAETTNSGLASRVITPGMGTEYPLAESVVTVHYTGWTLDGKMFDSSVARGEPISFPLNGVIPGWREGVMLMVEGETRRLWIPQDLAYKGQDPKGMLVFDVELLEIKPPGTPVQ